MAEECIVRGCDDEATTVHGMCKKHGARFCVVRADYRRKYGREIEAEEWAANGGSVPSHGDGRGRKRRLPASPSPASATETAAPEEDVEAQPDVTDRLVDLFLARTDWTAMPAALKRRIVALCLDELG